MRPSTHSTSTNDQFWGLKTSLNIYGGKNIHTKKIEKDLKQKLSEMGYSKKAIQEIFKWIPTDRQI